MFVTRFAPSPTGRLHKGHAVSALTARSAARTAGGRFLVRVEDIDPTRCRVEFEAGLLEDLEIEMPPLGSIGTGQLIANIDRSWDKRDDIRAAIEKHRAKLTARAAQTNQLLLEQLRRQEEQRSATAVGDQPPLA